MNLRNLRWTYDRPSTSPRELFPLTHLDLLLSSNVGISDPALLRIARDNELTPRDNVVFLLQTAAEIEHSLLVQYLFAAYSLEIGQTGTPVFRGKPPANALSLTTAWRKELLKIAKEEMAHLLTVQNVLRLLGGALHFGRESFPYRSDFYPFRFTLRPVTRTSLAMYVVAEMPPDPNPQVLSKSEQVAIVKRATSSQGTGGVVINHVGTLYRSIIALLSVLDPSKDFRADVSGWIAGMNWAAPGANFIIPPVNNRDDAVTGLGRIAEQGEGHIGAAPDGKSHFERFLNIYRSFPESEEEKGTLEWDPARSIARNPNTSDPPWEQGTLDPIAAFEESELEPGRITNQNTRLWAQLFNVRYRMLLNYLAHALYRKVVPNSLRETLHLQAINEMFNLTPIADSLTYMNIRSDTAIPSLKAGPPFELPYSITLPDRESDRWRLHADLLNASKELISKIPGSAQDQTLQLILQADSDSDWINTIQQQIAAARPYEDQP